MYILYYRPFCPFCQIVLDFAKNNDIEFELRDIAQEDNLESLLQIGGQQLVPFLIDEENDQTIYESDDIIEYLANQKENS